MIRSRRLSLSAVRRLAAGWSVALTLLLAPRLDAQSRSHEFAIAAGGAFVTSTVASEPAAGALLQLSVVQGPSAGRVRARLGAELLRAALDRSVGLDVTLTNVGVHYDVLMGPVRSGTAGYAVLGLGGSVAADDGVDSWPAVLFTARTGVGIRRRLAVREVYAEAMLVTLVAGAGGPVRPRPVWWPLSVGVTF